MFKNHQKFFSLPKEEHEELTFQEVEEGVYFRGHNLWLLVIAMGIACIGLNINSQSAIIGAMLISPLMGPVVGLAFGLAIHNKRLVRLSLYNWFVMIITSLLASTLYFLISPFQETTAQMSSFSEASIFDCLLAFLGGIAWFLGIVRKEAIKVIAGVAVATACIPPLCTAGYGLATANWEVFLGAMYFYLINCFYIGVGAGVVSIILGFRKYYLQQNNGLQQKNIYLALGFSLLLLVPSIWITVKKWEKQNFKEESEEYIGQIKKENPEIEILKYENILENDKKTLKITVLNDSLFLSKAKLDQYNALNKSIELEWHYSHNSTQKNSIENLQKQIDELKLELKNVQK